MEKIKETDKIKRLVKLSELSKSIVAKIQAMPEVNELKFDLDIILYVCEIIENNIKQTNWMIKKIVWSTFSYALDYFELNFYKKAKIEIISNILLKIYLKKHIVILIVSFI